MTKEQLEALVLLAHGDPATPVVACSWDSMEKPHIRIALPPGSHCHSRHDLPRSAQEAELIAALLNYRHELIALARRALQLTAEGSANE